MEPYNDDDLKQIAWELARGIEDFIANLDHACQENYSDYLLTDLNNTIGVQIDALDTIVNYNAPESSPWHARFAAAQARLADSRNPISWISAAHEDSEKQTYAAQAREQLGYGVQACSE